MSKIRHLKIYIIGLLILISVLVCNNIYAKDLNFKATIDGDKMTYTKYAKATTQNRGYQKFSAPLNKRNDLLRDGTYNTIKLVFHLPYTSMYDINGDEISYIASKEKTFVEDAEFEENGSNVEEESVTIAKTYDSNKGKDIRMKNPQFDAVGKLDVTDNVQEEETIDDYRSTATYTIFGEDYATLKDYLINNSKDASLVNETNTDAGYKDGKINIIDLNR